MKKRKGEMKIKSIAVEVVFPWDSLHEKEEGLDSEVISASHEAQSFQVWILTGGGKGPQFPLAFAKVDNVWNHTINLPIRK